MPEYNFTEMTIADAHSTLALLRELHPHLTQAEIDRAIDNQYQLFVLQNEFHVLGVAGIHVYPHLSDTSRAWIHDLITVSDQASLEYKTRLLANIRNQYLSHECPEIAIHIPIDDERENAFFLKAAGQPFASVYEWTRSAWMSCTSPTQLVSNFQCREIKTRADQVSGLALLQHFHPALSQASLAHAIANGYRVFGLWNEGQLCSIASLIHYPHLTNGTCVWLQDGMTLPTKHYQQAASSLLGYVMDQCFNAGSLTVSVHARSKNKRIHRFYQAAGGRHIANAYKWKMT